RSKSIMQRVQDFEVRTARELEGAIQRARGMGMRIRPEWVNGRDYMLGSTFIWFENGHPTVIIDHFGLRPDMTIMVGRFPPMTTPDGLQYYPAAYGNAIDREYAIE